jgi:predicted GNAT superfamily acetyltransferase
MKKFDTVHTLQGKRFLFKVESSQNLSDFLKYEHLRFEVWGDPRDNLAGARNLCVENYFHDGNNCLIGVYIEDAKGNFQEDESHIVGFAYGYIGVKDKNKGFRDVANIIFYSQYVGVKKEYRNYRLGVLIKEFQKEVVMDLYGLSIITCTYDPLVGINAYRNIHIFRMSVYEYCVSRYQGFLGNLNRADVPVDRLSIHWDLKKKATVPDYDLKKLVESHSFAVDSEMVEVMGKSGPLRTKLVKTANLDLDRDHLLIEVPFDFYKVLQETDVPDESVRRIPLDWRIETRKAFKELLKRGYRVLDFNYMKAEGQIRDFYIMKGPS